MIRKLLRPFRNFYFLSGLFFIVWMLFIDSNNLITQLRQRHKISELQSQKKFYGQQIVDVEKDRRELLTDDKLLEKFAREKYFMKKSTEDLYILVEE
jgi:hypothetical protein